MKRRRKGFLRVSLYRPQKERFFVYVLVYKKVKIYKKSHPRFGRDYPQNLSISLCGGKEIKRDSSSNGE